MILIFFALALSSSVTQMHARPERPQVLVAGVYHMANPAQDVFNMAIDDVLSARRQAEIEEVIDVLRGFRPTKIAVEAAFSDRRIAARYAEYRAGAHEFTRNEFEQLGFRLARDLGHETVSRECRR